MTLGTDAFWLRPFPRRARGHLWMESRVHEVAFGTVLGIWLIALLLGLLLAWPQIAPPGFLFWALPTVCSAIFLAGRISGSERRLGVEEFTLSLPVSRRTKYWISFGLAAGSWLALTAGCWLFLYAPIWFRGLRDDGDRLMLNVNQSAWVLSASWLLLCFIFGLMADWRASERYDVLVKQWPWLFLVLTFVGTEEIEFGREWPLIFNLPLLLIGAAMLPWGLARYLRKGVGGVLTGRGVPWTFRLLRPFLGKPGSRRGLMSLELRTLDGSWVVLLSSMVLPALLLGCLGDGFPRAYLPWILLGVGLLCFSGTATWVAGTKSDFELDEFVAALPPLRRSRFRTRFFLGLSLATSFIAVVLAILQLKLVPFLMSWMPAAVRRTPLGTEALPPLFNLETALLLAPLAWFAYSSSYMISSRFRELGKDSSENAAGKTSLVLPSLAVMVGHFLGSVLGVVWLSTGLLMLAGVFGGLYFFRRAQQRALTLDLPEPQQKCKGIGFQILGMFGGMLLVVAGFGFLLGVGEADRLGRYHAAGNLEFEEFLGRLKPGRVPGWIAESYRAGHADCLALADDPEKCGERSSRRKVLWGGLERSERNDRIDLFEDDHSIHPRWMRYSEEFAASGMDAPEFVRRLEEAASDSELEVLDRGWYARSGRSLDDFKKRQNGVRDRLAPVWGGRAER